MRSSIFKKLWESSPGSLCRAVQKRIEERKQISGWFTVRAGPLAGAELFLPSKVGLWKEMLEGKFDEFIYSQLPIKNVQGSVFWDIGAHVGYHSLAFAALGAEVLAFEPNAHNAAQLKAHLERNPKLARKIRHSPVAVSDRDGEMTFVQSSDLGGQSSGSHLQKALPPLASEAYANFQQISVNAVRIDTLIESGERVPDIIKVDVEGAEYLVLQGGTKFFTSHKPVLLIEVHNISLMFHVQKFLCKIGYDTILADEQNSSTSRCFVIAGNTNT